MRGLSVGDAVKCGVNGLIASGVAAFVFFMFKVEILWCVLGVMLTIAASGTVLQRSDNGLSVMDILRIAVKFSREQKRYYYVYRRRK